MRTSSQLVDTDSPKLAVVTNSLQNYIDRTVEHNKLLGYLIDVSSDMNSRVFGGETLANNEKASECPPGSIPTLMWLLNDQGRAVSALRDQVNNIAALINYSAQVALTEPVEQPTHESTLHEIESRLVEHTRDLYAIETAVASLVEHAFDELSAAVADGSSDAKASVGMLNRLDAQFAMQRSTLDNIENALQRLRTIG